MKTIILKISAFVCVVLLLLTATFATSCKKDQSVHGKVTVIDSVGTRIAGAKVSLSATNANPPGTAALPSEVTNAYGEADFTIKLPGVFEITAISANYPGKVGTGVLILNDPRSSDSKTVTLR